MKNESRMWLWEMMKNHAEVSKNGVKINLPFEAVETNFPKLLKSLRVSFDNSGKPSSWLLEMMREYSEVSREGVIINLPFYVIMTNFPNLIKALRDSVDKNPKVEPMPPNKPMGKYPLNNLLAQLDARSTPTR
jgi:hypothetical protein